MRQGNDGLVTGYDKLPESEHQVVLFRADFDRLVYLFFPCMRNQAHFAGNGVTAKIYMLERCPNTLSV